MGILAIHRNDLPVEGWAAMELDLTNSADNYGNFTI
jgi:hypothetical protein